MTLHMVVKDLMQILKSPDEARKYLAEHCPDIDAELMSDDCAVVEALDYVAKTVIPLAMKEKNLSKYDEH